MSEQQEGAPTNPADIIIGGIPISFEAITSLPKKSTVITSTTSGRKLAVDVSSQDHIKIEDKDNPDDYFFEAEFFDKKDETEEDPDNPYLPLSYFSAVTVLKSDDARLRHPDLRAGELIDASLRYFERNFGPVNGMLFAWGAPVKTHNYHTGEKINVPASDNFEFYLTARNRILQKLRTDGLLTEETIKKAKEEAVKETWTWKRVAMPKGFTHIVRIEENEEEAKVTGLLVKPEVAAKIAEEQKLR